MKNNPELPDMPDGTTDIQDTPPWMTRDYLPLTVSPLVTEGTQPLPDEPIPDMPDFTLGNPVDHMAWRLLTGGFDTTNMPDGNIQAVLRRICRRHEDCRITTHNHH